MIFQIFEHINLILVFTTQLSHIMTQFTPGFIEKVNPITNQICYLKFVPTTKEKYINIKPINFTNKSN